MVIHPSNDDLYLVYEEINKKSTNLFGIIKRSKATLVKINGEGSMQSKVISTAEENEVALLPKFAGHSGPNSFLMTGKNAARKFKFMNIKF